LTLLSFFGLHSLVFALWVIAFVKVYGIAQDLPAKKRLANYTEGPMNQSLSIVAVVVKDFDEAIEFYTQKLGFDLVEDTYQPEQDKRWVVVKPKGDGTASVLLAKASNAQQEKAIGNQTGGRVFLFLQTDDFTRDFEAYKSKGVKFTRPPATHPYGTVAVFEDLCGNLWDLVQFS
jgi:catechol 2,3-dioxygenase-like lactoylglutathione lyase family enzyme